MMIPRLSLCIALTLLPSIALADEPSEAQRAEAVKRFNEGIASSTRGDFEAARLRFLQALVVFPERPSLLWNLGVAEMKTHHPAAAIGHIKAYLRLPDATNADRVKARGLLEEAARETGHVVIAVDPGAVVRLDDGSFADAPTEPLDVEPGPHVLEARVGTKAKTASVSPQAGETVNADLRLAPATETAPTAASPAAATPAVVPTATPGAPPAPLESPPQPSPPLSTARIAVPVLLGAGAVSAVVLGAVFLGSASSEGNRGAAALGSAAPGGCSNPANASACDTGHQAAQREADDKNLATGMFVAGGVLAAGAVASWFLLAPKSERTSGARLAPMVSPTAAGCVLSGRF